MTTANLEWDIFLSHATEDKETFVRPLAKKLVESGIKTWYDEFEVQLGDSIRESIDRGLRLSKFAIIVLSKSYFQKSWTNNELNGYFSVDNGFAKRILPIWYNVNRDEVFNYSPMLADRVAENADNGFDAIIQKVKKRLNINFVNQSNKNEKAIPLLNKQINWTSLSEFTNFRFPNLGIDEYWQAVLLEDIAGNVNYQTINDLDTALIKASIAVAVFARNSPSRFETGTDYITKSLGFVDSNFRGVHDFSATTRMALEKYRILLRK